MGGWGVEIQNLLFMVKIATEMSDNVHRLKLNKNHNISKLYLLPTSGKMGKGKNIVLCTTASVGLNSWEKRRVFHLPVPCKEKGTSSFHSNVTTSISGTSIKILPRQNPSALRRYTYMHLFYTFLVT
jgi:hypothetical protein